MFDSIWYDNLIKPAHLPAAWFFSTIWIMLYGTLLVSLIIYTFTFSYKNKINGYIIFVIHMIFNLMWSFIFFSLHRIDIALAVVVIMDLTAVFMTAKFFSVSKASGLILVPYLAWIFFATYLNTMFLILN